MISPSESTFITPTAETVFLHFQLSFLIPATRSSLSIFLKAFGNSKVYCGRLINTLSKSHLPVSMPLCSLPSHKDSGLDDVTCFGQWDSQTLCTINRGMKSAYALLPGTLLLRCEKAEAGLGEDGRKCRDSAYCYQKEHKAAFLLIGGKKNIAFSQKLSKFNQAISL